MAHMQLDHTTSALLDVSGMHGESAQSWLHFIQTKSIDSVEELIKQLRSQFIPLINENHDIDQALVNSWCANSFGACESEKNKKEKIVSKNIEDFETKKSSHATCRGDEATLTRSKATKCANMERIALCDSSVYESKTFEEVDAFTKSVLACKGDTDARKQKAASCSKLQTSMQEAYCTYLNNNIDMLDEYLSCVTAANKTFPEQAKVVVDREKARKLKFKEAETTICIVQDVLTLNVSHGAGVTHDNVAAAITKCRTMQPNTSNFSIEYCTGPSVPPVDLYDNSAPGDAAWAKEHYGDLDALTADAPLDAVPFCTGAPSFQEIQQMKVSTFAGTWNSHGVNTGNGGNAEDAKLYYPHGNPAVYDGALYFSERSGNSPALRKIDLRTNIITQVSTPCGGGCDIYDIVADNQGILYLTNTVEEIRAFTIATGDVRRIIGTGSEGYTYNANHNTPSAKKNPCTTGTGYAIFNPYGGAAVDDTQGWTRYFWADISNHVIRYSDIDSSGSAPVASCPVTAAGASCTNSMGSSQNVNCRDTSAQKNLNNVDSTSQKLDHPYGLTVDTADRKLYFFDNDGRDLIVLDLQTWKMSSLGFRSSHVWRSVFEPVSGGMFLEVHESGDCIRGMYPRKATAVTELIGQCGKSDDGNEGHADDIAAKDARFVHIRGFTYDQVGRRFFLSNYNNEVITVVGHEKML